MSDPNETAGQAPAIEEPAAAEAPVEAAPEVSSDVDKTKHVLFMGNLAFTVNKDKLITFFKEKELSVVGLRIPTDKVKGEPKGFAFVEFASPEDLETALVLNGTELMGRAIKIEKTVEKKDREEGKPKQEWADASQVELRFAVPAPFVRKIIGKKGETIKKVSKDSGARAMFGERLPESWTLGNDLQHLSVKGTMDQVQAAVGLIVAEMIAFEKENGKVDEFSRAAEGHVSLTMLIPLEKIPMVIGQRGARIKEIERLSKTVVDVQEDQVYSEKYVSFTGEKDEVANAVAIAAKGLPVDTWEPSRPCVTPKTRENGRGGKGGGKGGPPRGGGRYDDRGPHPRFRGPPPRDYDDRFGRGPPRGPPRYDDFDRGPPLKRPRPDYERGPPPPRGGYGGGYGGGAGYGRGPPPPRRDDFW